VRGRAHSLARAAPLQQFAALRPAARPRPPPWLPQLPWRSALRVSPGPPPWPVCVQQQVRHTRRSYVRVLEQEPLVCARWRQGDAKDLHDLHSSAEPESPRHAFNALPEAKPVIPLCFGLQIPQGKRGAVGSDQLTPFAKSRAHEQPCTTLSLTCTSASASGLRHAPERSLMEIMFWASRSCSDSSRTCVHGRACETNMHV